MLRSPYTIHGEEFRDATAWQLWWEFNGAPYVDWRSIDTRARRTGSRDFFLGQGQRDPSTTGARATPEDVQWEIVPALETVLRAGGDVELVRATILANARASRATDGASLKHSLGHFLEHNDTARIRRAAAASLGILGDPASAGALVDIAIDSTAGRRSCGGGEIDLALREHALYGLALLAPIAGPEVRRMITDNLIALVDREDDAELRAAAVYALGFAPLPASGGRARCTCGSHEVADVARHVEGQVTWLIRVVHDEDEGALVRARATESLARLVSAPATDASARLKEDVADLLIKALDERSRVSASTRRSAVLGLARIGDADGDAIDDWIRWALHRSLSRGDPLEKRFALMGMARIAGRPGQGAVPFAATDELRSHLVHHLASGRKDLRPWAALSLGVLGHWLRASGAPTSEDVDRSLRAALRNCRRADELGAYALAVGLRRDSEAGASLLEKLERTRDPGARGYVALAIGLLEDRTALRPLREILVDADTDPHLRRSVGWSLGMLRDPAVVPTLIGSLDGEELELTTGVVSALGRIGDARSIEVLTDLFEDPETADALRTVVATALGRMSDPDPVDWRSRLASGINYVASPASLTNPGGTGLLDR